jgi:hypothetical protein
MLEDNRNVSEPSRRRKNSIWLIAIIVAQLVSLANGPDCTAAVLGNTVITAPKSSPRLNLITPRGIRIGEEHTLKFAGARLKDAEEVFFYDTGITVVSIEPIDANNINVKVKVAADCRVGEHVAQVRTKNGISDYRSVFVGRLPEVAEAEPNNDLTAAQNIDLNVTVTGIVNTEDIDYFRIEGKKGERISVEVEALRLGYLFDPAIALLDKNRFEIAVSDDTPLTKQDSFFSVILPEDGQYFITIRESSFVGNDLSHYRMHVGNFPRPAAVYPAGGKPGESLELQFIDTFFEGQPVRSVGKQTTLPKTEGFRGGIFYEDSDGISPSPMPFRLVDLNNHLEQEPNNNFTQTQTVTLPHAINGVISQPGDYDYFKFTAKKGQVWHVECFARRLGSGLDAVLHIFDANKKVLVGNDDSKKADSYIRFQAPADGDYFVRVYDHLRRGQPDFVYRIELTPRKPSLTLDIKRIDRYSQQRQTIAVPQGGRFAVLMNGARQDFVGEVELLGDNLPAGIKMQAKPMHKNLNTMPVVFEVDEQAPLGGALIDFKGQHSLNGVQTLAGSFGNAADFVLGQPNNAVYYHCHVDKLAFAVVEKLPFKLEIVQPTAPMVRNGQKSLKIIAHRDKGFEDQINLQFPFRSPGVGTTYQIVMPKGKSEAYYPLNANSKAQLGKWPMYVIGTSNFKGPAWTSTQLGELEIAEPFVTVEIPRMSIERGQATELICKLNQLIPFEGEAKAEIIGVPANIVVEGPKQFTKDTQELSFSIQTSDKSPIGKHGGLFCRVTVTHAGEPVVSRAGNALLQINKPKPPKVEPKPPIAVTPSAAKPAPQPKTKSVTKPAAKPAATQKPVSTKPAK